MVQEEPAANPYVGPRAFREQEALYGRDREKRDLLDLLVARRIVLLYSPSGAGKSSLINAGLIPALKEDGFRVLPVVRVNLDPLAALGLKSLEELPLQADRPFNRYIFSVLLSFEENLPVEERIPPAELASMSLEDYLTRCPRQPGEPADDVLIFDQFEEIITTSPTDREGKKAFFAEVGAALRSRSRWALFAMREDYMPALDPYLRPVPTRFANTFRLDFLGVEAARQAIQNPALDRNVRFTTPAADKLIDDLRTVQVQQPDGRMETEKGLYVEPVQLQVVCFRLWEKLEPGADQITEADITTDLEGLAQSLVDRSLAGYYSDCVAATVAELRKKEIPVSERDIREWFEYRLITEHNVRGQVLRGIEKSEGLRNEAIDRLVGAHLVRAENRARAIWYELAHDRLIQPVRESNAVWMRQNLVQLQSQAILWNREGEKDSLLLRGEELAAAREWAEAHEQELRPVERRFLKLSQEAADQEERARLEAERAYQQRLELESAQQVAAIERQRAEAERRRAEAEKQQAAAERQQAEAERKAASHLRQLALVLAAALIAALALSVIIYFLYTDASQQRAIAQNEKAIAESERLKAQQAQAGAENSEILAVIQRATAEAAEAEARRQAGIALQQGQIATARQLAAQAYSLKGDQPDLALLLSLEGVRQLEANSISQVIEPKASLVDVLAGSSLVASFYPQSDYVYGLAISRDGRRLASIGYDSVLGYDSVQVWDLDSGRLITETTGVEVVGWSLSPDGKTFAYSGYYTGVSVWNIDNGSITEIIPQASGFHPILAYSPDGSSLAIAGQGLQLWQAGSGELQTLSDSIYQYPLAFSGDGSLLAAVTQGNSLELWDLAAQEPMFLPLERMEESFFISSLALSTDDQGQPLLAVLDGNGSLLVWDLSTRQVLSAGFQAPGFPFILSAGGTNLAYRSADGTLQVCRLNLGSASCSPLKAFKGAPGEVGLLAFSPDGNMLAEGRNDGSIQVWQLAGSLLTGAPLQASGSPVAGLAFRSVDGGTGLVTAAKGREKPRLWDLASPYPPVELDVRVRPAVDFTSTRLAFSPDGRTLISGDRDGSLRLWDADTLQLSASLYGHSAAIRSTAASPDEKYLASVDQNEVMIVWDLENSLPLPSFQDVPGVTAAAFSPDGKTLAAGQTDGSVILWDVSTGFPVRTLSPANSSGSVAGLVFGPRNMLLAVGYENAASGAQAAGQAAGQSAAPADNLILWDLKPANPVSYPLQAHTSTVSHLAFDRSGGQLASGDAEGRIYLWNVNEKRAQPFKGISGAITGLAFSRFNDFLIAGLDQAIARCRLDALTCESAFSGAARFTSNPALAPGRDILAAGTVQGEILLWDLYTKEAYGSIQSGEQEETSLRVTSLALSPDERTLALGGVDGSVLLWDLEAGERLGEARSPHAKAVTDLAFSSDGQWLASSGLDGAVKIWDSQGREVSHYSEPGGGAPVLAFRPGSAELAIRYNPELQAGFSPGQISPFGPGLIPPAGTISFEGSSMQASSPVLLWDLSDAQSEPQPASLPGGSSIDWVASMAFSPDGARLVFGLSDGSLVLWEIASAQPLRTLSTGLAQSVSSLAFSPDGTWLAAGLQDGTLILWDAGSGSWEQVSRLAALGGGEPVLAFDPDGDLLASGGRDGTVLLWDVDPDRWTAKACKAAGRNLRWSEWDKYLNPGPGQLYSETCPGSYVPPDVITGQIERLKSGDLEPEQVRQSLSSAVRWSEAVSDVQVLARVCAFGTSQGLDAEVGSVCDRLNEMLPDAASQAYLYAEIGEAALAQQIVAQIDDPYTRADIYYRLGETGRALQEAGQIEDTSTRAGFYLQIGQEDRARELAEQIENPINRAYFFYYQLEDRERALEIAEQIESENDRALFYYQIGEIVEARLLAETIENPYDRAYLYYLLNENALARQIAGQVENPNDRAYLYYLIGEIELASQAAEQVEPLYERAYLYTLLGDSNRVKQIAGQLEDAYQRASLYLQIGEVALAEDAAGQIEDLRQRASLYSYYGYYQLAMQLAEQADDPLQRAAIYLDMGETGLAQDAIREAVGSDPARSDPDYANEICWDGSLAGLADEVLPACEQAVRLAGDLNLGEEALISYRDSRGLARALSGDTAGAIEDFQFVVEALKARGSSLFSAEALDLFLTTRESYLAELQAGRDPFDQDTLDYLRSESY